MVNQLAQDEVDVVLHALADPTRRRIVEQLGSGPASVSTLAAPLSMSLPAVVSHLRVLEDSGVITTEKVGRVRTCRLEVTRLQTVDDWIAARRRTWERRLDRLGEFLAATAADAVHTTGDAVSTGVVAPATDDVENGSSVPSTRRPTDQPEGDHR